MVNRQISAQAIHQILLQDQFILPLGMCNWTAVNYLTPGALGSKSYATLSAVDQERLQNKIIAAVKRA